MKPMSSMEVLAEHDADAVAGQGSVCVDVVLYRVARAAGQYRDGLGVKDMDVTGRCGDSWWPPGPDGV